MQANIQLYWHLKDYFSQRNCVLNSRDQAPDLLINALKIVVLVIHIDNVVMKYYKPQIKIIC